MGGSVRRIAGCAVLVACVVLSGCGGEAGTSPAEGGAGAVPSARDTTGPWRDPLGEGGTGPWKHEGSETLRPPKPPKPRGPVLSYEAPGGWTYDIQVVDAGTRPEDPGGNVRQPGTTNLIVTLAIRGTAADRPSVAPAHGYLHVVAPSCESEPFSCPNLGWGVDYYTADQAAYGFEGEGVRGLFGKLEPEVTYYTYAWGGVREELDLAGAELCVPEGPRDKGDCIPLGEVSTNSKG